ncbi:hypothetical protein Patl1_07412 [Pistacia atlantica]|uniref:Uncharacterized protein n=1 Tax=Pistacia atlantica TaxID=434234 RepID=A0ACC1AFU6_9ROSI|nr:hypothetical protein Patl1_07412 [Pistacia atlantica]
MSPFEITYGREPPPLFNYCAAISSNFYGTPVIQQIESSILWAIRGGGTNWFCGISTSVTCSVSTILHQGVPVCEALVQWEHLPLEDASWEPWDDALIDGLEDKAVSHGEGNVTKIQHEANSSQQPVDVLDVVVTRPKRNLRMPTHLLD